MNECAKIPSESACEFMDVCPFANACGCKGVKEKQCRIVSVFGTLNFVNNEGERPCKAKIRFGNDSFFCQCMKREAM